MFGLFKKKSEWELLEQKYKDLLREAYELSSVNRKAADLKTAEAEKIAEKLQQLKKG